MKSFFIIAALALSLSLTASTSTTPLSETIIINQDKEYKKIEESKVPAVILNEISTKYDGHKITDAAVSVDEEYRITVTKDSKSTKVYFTATGEFIKEEK
jgi:hypothetical protein